MMAIQPTAMAAAQLVRMSRIGSATAARPPHVHPIQIRTEPQIRPTSVPMTQIKPRLVAAAAVSRRECVTTTAADLGIRRQGGAAVGPVHHAICKAETLMEMARATTGTAAQPTRIKRTLVLAAVG